MRRMNSKDPLFENWLTGDSAVQFAFFDTIRQGENALLCTDDHAEMLVGQVNRGLLQKGLLPVLYADRDYKPSNAAYQRIGYLKCGEIHEFAFY